MGKRETNFNLECSLNINAADGDADSVPTFELVAYSGGKMNVGFGDVVVDLEGLTWTEKARPILLEHARSLRLGMTTGIEIINGSLIVKGDLVGTSQEARDVIADAKAGFPFQASVGVSVQDMIKVEANETLEINGSEIEGACLVAVASTLKEISFVALAADDSTTVSVAASAAPAENEKDDQEIFAMDEDLKIDGVDEIRAAQVGELKRCADIRAACGDNSDVALKHIEAGSTVDAAKIEALEASIEAAKIEAPTVIVNASAAPAQNDKLLEASAMKFAGVDSDVVAKSCGEELAASANAMALGELVLRCASRAGVTGYSAKDSDTIEAAFSTIGGLSGILGNVANKVLLGAYETGDSIIDRLAARQTVSDFKATSQYRLTLSGDYALVGPSGELKSTDVVQESMTAQAQTRGVILTLTREMLINDDLGAFLNLFADLARTADRARERVGLGAMVDAASFWTVGNSNLVSGSATALSSASLSKAIETLSLQTDVDGQPIGIRGKYLVVPTALEATAKQLMASMTITGASDGDVNIHAGAFEVLSSPLLQAGSFTNTSALAWYLCADPSVAPVVTMSYLNGNVAPVIEQVDLQGAQLGVQFRAYSDFGANSSDYRCGVKMKGEA